MDSTVMWGRRTASGLEFVETSTSSTRRARVAIRSPEPDGQRRTEDTVRKIVVNEWMTLDGVVQAPGSAEEDPTGGFGHGGWHLPYFDERSRRWVIDNISAAGGFLLGRRTYDILAAYWPTAPRAERELADPLNHRPKYVASRTRTQRLDWHNSRLIEGDIAKAVSAMKEAGAGDLHVIGSPHLVHTLLAHELVDEFRLMIDPLMLGAGKRLFPDDGTPRSLRLHEFEVTATGAVLATYAVAVA